MTGLGAGPERTPLLARTTALLLAGGQSRRMGRPKAFLPFGDEALLQRLVRRFGAWCGEVAVVAAPDQELPPVPVPVWSDEVPGQGPLGGIATGLARASREACFVCSCDHPFPGEALVAAQVAQLADHDICAVRWEGIVQPLFTAYRRSLLPAVRERLARGRFRPVELFAEVRTRILEPEDVLPLDPGGLSLLDVDDPDAYARALALLPAKG